MALLVLAFGPIAACASEIPAPPELDDPADMRTPTKQGAARPPAGRPRLRDDNCGLPTMTAPVPAPAVGRFRNRVSAVIVAAETTATDDAPVSKPGRVRATNHAQAEIVEDVPALEVSAPQQPTAELMPEPAQKPLRFKHIREILPYEDYEPDPEVVAKDKCANLCPRGPDCPECKNRNGELPGDTTICPVCPKEEPVPGQDRTDVPLFAYPTRAFPHIDYCWEASNLYHQPLYFEDFCLERYGHTRHYLLQPLVSTSIFAVQLLGLPYQASIDPIWKKRYTLGWHRPGKFVPYKYYQVPWNTQAAVTEAAFVTGGYFLFAPGVSP